MDVENNVTSRQHRERDVNRRGDEDEEEVPGYSENVTKAAEDGQCLTKQTELWKRAGSQLQLQ